jgi:RNA polymerase sigma-70 factor (ECF subfamily)
MVNTAINYLKSESRYQYDLSFIEENLHLVSDENPELILNAKDLADLIRQLPTGYQTIFNMHAVEGYTHVEIGKILGIHEGTSKSQYARARALLITWITKNTLEKKTDMYARK